MSALFPDPATGALNHVLRSAPLALERLRRRGWIKSEWRTTEHHRQARYYELTPAGRRQLSLERAAWERSSSAVNWILAWSGDRA